MSKQYFDDFSSFAAGDIESQDNPYDIATEGDWAITVTADLDAKGGKYLDFDDNGYGDGINYVGRRGLLTSGDTEVVCRCKLGGNSTSVDVRGPVLAQVDLACYSLSYQSANQIVLYRYNTSWGTEETLGLTAFTYTSDWVWMRLGRVDNVIRAKIWNDGSPEPHVWQISDVPDTVYGALFPAYGVQYYIPAPYALDTFGVGLDAEAPKSIYDIDEAPPIGPAVIRRPWTKQPPVGTKIDWSNPIARKLAFLWSGPHTGGGYGADLISGYKVPNYGTGDDVVVGTDAKGHIASQVNDGASVKMLDFDSAPSFDCIGGYSWFVIQRLTDSSVTWRTALALYNGTGFEDTDIIAMAYPITDVTGRAQVYGGPGGSINWDNDVPWTANDGAWHTWGVSTPWSATGTRGFFDGKYVASTADTLGNAAETVDAVQLLSNDTWQEEGLGGDLLLAAVFKERLSDAEQASLAENPWQVFKPKSIYVATPPERRLVGF